MRPDDPRAHAASHWAAALQRIPPRAARVLTLVLLERQPLADCARFYGVAEGSFCSLLAMSLAELASQEGLTETAQLLSSPGGPPSLQRALQRLQASGAAALQPDSALETLVFALWRAGPAALPPAPPALAPEPRWRTLLRWAVIALAVGAVLWWSGAF